MVYGLFCWVSDEEEVGPWTRGSTVPFRQKALSKVKINKYNK